MNDAESFGWWQRNIVEPGKLPLFLLAVAFIVTFLVTRLVTRLIRSGRGPFSNNVTASGLHIHHSIPGLILLVVGAVLGVGSVTSPWLELAGLLVGAGASLVLDEFAMILHLDDVYWAKEGQASVQAVALTAMVLVLSLIGLTPFGVNDVGAAEAGARWIGLTSIVVACIAVVIAAMKGKYRLGMLAVFMPVVAIVAAVRLARPDSAWARRRYDGAKLQRARERARHFDARWDPMWRAIGDLVAGTPEPSDQPASSGH